MKKISSYLLSRTRTPAGSRMQRALLVQRRLFGRPASRNRESLGKPGKTWEIKSHTRRRLGTLKSLAEMAAWPCLACLAAAPARTHARASFVRSPRPLLPCAALRGFELAAGRVRAPSRLRLAIGRCHKIRYAVKRERRNPTTGFRILRLRQSGAFVPFSSCQNALPSNCLAPPARFLPGV